LLVSVGEIGDAAGRGDDAQRGDVVEAVRVGRQHGWELIYEGGGVQEEAPAERAVSCLQCFANPACGPKAWCWGGEGGLLEVCRQVEQTEGAAGGGEQQLALGKENNAVVR
jgi:hypothetical protein